MKARHASWLLLLVVLAVPALARGTGYELAVERMELGDYRGAVALWSQWLALHPGDPRSLLQRGQALSALGFRNDALVDLEAALVGSEAVGDEELQALVLIALGRAYYDAQSWNKALDRLQQAEDRAARLGEPGLEASALSLLGSLALVSGDREAARRYFDLGEAKALDAGSAGQTADLRLKLAHAQDDRERARMLLERVYADRGAIPEPLDRTLVLVALGEEAQEQGQPALAYRALVEAAPAARSLGQDRLLSEALGSLGQLYEGQGRLDESLALTGEAIAVAGREPAPDLLMRWEWQQGRVQRAVGSPDAALASYRRAVAHLQSIRADIPVQYRDGRSSFRNTLAPVYLGLVELLLERSRAEADEAASQALLADAQDTVELLKTAELQDYFADACAVVQAPLLDLEEVAGGTAVLYPIILPDRLEMLAQIGGRKYVHRVPLAADRLEALTSRLVRGLRPTAAGRLRSFPREYAQELYDQLVGPFAKRLKEARVHTLVFVPDGILRNLPIGVLWDGEGYLVERYAVATVPGLTLLDPKPIPRARIGALLSGLSRPGPVVDTLPEAMRLSLGSSWEVDEGTRGMHRIAVRALPPTTEVDEPFGEGPTRQRLQQALALPGVVQELDEIAAILPSRRLLDEEFRLDDFKRELQKDYRIVHIASHGVFSGDPEKSFIITYDQVLSMDQLSKLFASERYAEGAVEILTLSACQTAEGDDRSPLGLSGVALRSGARSALGSLWPVSDKAARILLPEFYRNLKRRDLTKAQALQLAQVELLHREGFEHPSFWSSFILIGNWL